jgi:phosphate starvation-inducible PhoH-like protein
MKFLFLCSSVLYRSSSLRPASPGLRLASSSLRLASSSLRPASSSLRPASSGLRLTSSSSGLFDSPEEIFTQKGRGSLRKKKTRLDKCVPIQTQYAPRGLHQRQYVDYLKDPSVSIVLGVGPAGCGKTLFACYRAIQDLKCRTVEKIIMTRPLVSVDKEELGFLPGTLVNKMDPWTRPIFDIFSEFFSQNEIEYMIKTGVIEISPLAYMRGRTFKHAFIIADEMQNSSPNQMLMMTTRIGEGSKMVITGDLKQSDRDNNSENGLRDFIQRVKRFQGENDEIRLVELDATDIERSPVVIKLLEMYDDVSPP